MTGSPDRRGPPDGAASPHPPASVVVLVPIYKPLPDPFELRSLDVSLATLAGRDIRFIGPAGLDTGFYTARYAGIGFESHDPVSFASVAGYSRLLLDRRFYLGDGVHDFMLILQPDAVVLRDELDHWCAQPFDYVGAPWPTPVELRINLDRFGGPHGRQVRATVGNGGLSLRRARACARLVDEFPEASDYFLRSGSSEDLFFALMGPLSTGFVLPNEIIASSFAMELQPSWYFATNGGREPMGGHAWWKYEPAFWEARLAAVETAVAG